MKHVLVSLLLIAIFWLAGSSVVLAFTRSEDELLRADVTEAKARAVDFRAQQERSRAADRERERMAGEIKRERQTFEAEQERVRLKYVSERDARGSEEAKQARLEQEFDRHRLEEERRMNENRLTYKKKRAKVQQLIETEAFIDGNAEYGL